MTEKRHTTCSACGTSPANHTLLLITSIFDDLVKKIGINPPGSYSLKRFKDLPNFIEKMVFNGMSYIGIVGFNHDIEKALTGRSKLIWEEAARRGIPMWQVTMFGKPVELYKAKINGKTFYFKSLPIPPSLDQRGYDWLDDKFALFEKLQHVGLHVPKTKKISSFAIALEAFKGLYKPIIVKPQHGSRGRHTTTNINNEIELKDAFNLAREITWSMILQEHLYGSVYRATVINNKLVGFFRADPPEIRGDGIHTIKESIEEKNKSRHERVSEIVINDDLVTFIKRQGYSIDSVLEKDVTISLSAKTGRMYGSYTREMLEEIHPKIHTIFEKAGKAVEAPVVGFDVIIEDPLKDPDEQRWGIIECNSLPFIDLHFFALEGPRINLAKNVWDLWKK